MKRRTMKLDIFLCCANGIQFLPIKKLNRRFLTVSLLLLFGASFTIIKGQTVNYVYDANGNVTSKKVVQPLDVTNFMVKQDTVRSFANFLAYYSPFRALSFSESTLTTPEVNVVKNPNEVNIKSSKDRTHQFVCLKNDIDESQAFAEKKTDNSHN